MRKLAQNILVKIILGKIMALPFWLHLALVPLLYLVMNAAQGILDASYARSGFPVDYMTGQTSFSGVASKAWYLVMTEQGTLGIYWQTQIIDYGFIVSVMALGLIFGTFMARLAMKHGWGYKVGMLAAVVIPLGALSDACENLVSFVMLSMPTTFPDWLALPYSSFAVAKFGLLALGMLLLMISLIVNLIERLIAAYQARRAKLA